MKVSLKCINSIFHVNSGYNFLLELVWKNNFEANDWLQGLKTEFEIEILSSKL